MKLHSICKNLLAVPEAEYIELEEIANIQASYLSPLRMATIERQHKLAAHNKAVLVKLKELRDTLRAGADI